jgi:hypothetical protein
LLQYFQYYNFSTALLLQTFSTAILVLRFVACVQPLVQTKGHFGFSTRHALLDGFGFLRGFV